MSKRKDIEFWIYDFEVFKYDWTVCFINHWTKETVKIHNDRDQLMAFLDAHPQMVLIGYNNNHYDDWILLAITHDINPFRVSSFIIDDRGTPYHYPAFKGLKKPFVTYDLISDMSLGGHSSLKQLEGYLGFKIYESEIPWDLDRPLTEEELIETIRYNEYDVQFTDFLFTYFGQRIDAHIALIEEYDLRPQDLSKTGAQKSALIFKARPFERYKVFRYKAPEVLKAVPELRSFVQMYEEKIFIAEQTNQLSHQVEIQGIKFDLGLGGLHGARSNYHYEGKIWNLDVASFYPNLMIHYNYVSKACPGGVQALREITQKRLEYKKQGHILDNALKLIIVAIYGNMAYKYSLMWDQEQQMSICITGQLMLLWLIMLLEPYAQIVQANTDGVMFIPHNEDEIRQVWKYWEEQTKMILELDEGHEIIQKDVNNYIYLKKPKSEIDPFDKIQCEKYIKVKGGMTRFWNDQMHTEGYNKVLDTFNNTLTILDECVVRNLVWGTPVRETLLRSNDPLRFMKVVKLQGKYKKGYWGDQILNGKTFRIFFTKTGQQVYKAYEKDDQVKKEKFANCSDNSIVLNEDIRSKTIQDLGLELDYDHYEKLAEQMIKLYKGE